MVEHGEQPPVGLERVALGEEPERRAPAHGEHQRVLARRHVQVLEDPLLDVVLHRAGLGAAVERVVAEVGIELGQCEGRGGGVPAGVEEAETTVVEADPAARAAAGGGGVEVGVVLDAEAVDVGRGGVVRVHGEEPGDGGGEERDVGGRAERAACRGERGGAEEVALRRSRASERERDTAASASASRRALRRPGRHSEPSSDAASSASRSWRRNDAGSSPRWPCSARCRGGGGSWRGGRRRSGRGASIGRDA